MNPFAAAMAASLLGDNSEKGSEEQVPISGVALEIIREEFVPIPNLKPGMKVVWKDKRYRDCTFPGTDQVVEVFSVLADEDRNGIKQEGGSNHALDHYDFSVMAVANGERISQFAFDSRRFKIAD